MHTTENEQNKIEFTGHTVGQIVAADYRTAEVFQRYGIDFCCGGDIALTQACAENNVDVNTVVRDLQQVFKSAETREDYNQWGLDFLAEYIVNQHHAYAKQVIPQLNAFAEKVARVHGDRHPETREIAEVWLEMSSDMIRHMQREELQLFPHIKKLVRTKEEDGSVTPPTFDSTSDLISELQGDHDATGGNLARIESLSNRFTPPQDACNTYRALYASLQEFAAKTKEHIHLENNILFPRAIRLATSGREEVPQ